MAVNVGSWSTTVTAQNAPQIPLTGPRVPYSSYRPHRRAELPFPPLVTSLLSNEYIPNTLSIVRLVNQSPVIPSQPFIPAVPLPQPPSPTLPSSPSASSHSLTSPLLKEYLLSSAPRSVRLRKGFNFVSK